MARTNDAGRQRTDLEARTLGQPDELQDMQEPQQPPAGSPWNGAGGVSSAVRVSGPAVDPVCPLCRQPVYPGYGTSSDGAEFHHFDCLRRKRGSGGREPDAR